MNSYHFFQLAWQLNEKYREHLLEYPARFRGNLNSLSLISLKCYKPQIGLEGVQKIVQREDFNIHDLLADLDKKPIPSRPTPEKRLQSWIIKNEMRNRTFSFNKNIRLITDELVLGSQTKLVADILGFNEMTKALVLIELKSSRELTKLTQQLTSSENDARANTNIYQNLLRVHLLEWPEPFKIEKIAIWPKGNTDLKRFPYDIHEFCYKEDNCDFTIEEVF